jgi:hypothetical protein
MRYWQSQTGLLYPIVNGKVKKTKTVLRQITKIKSKPTTSIDALLQKS